MTGSKITNTTHEIVDADGEILMRLAIGNGRLVYEIEGKTDTAGGASLCRDIAAGRLDGSLHFMLGSLVADPMMAKGATIRSAAPRAFGPYAPSGIILTESFYLLATETTEHWTIDTHGAAFDVSLVRDGETTHVASVTASSWAEFVENRFHGMLDRDEDDAAYVELAELTHENGGEHGTYVSYARHAERDARMVSELETFEFDADDYRRNDDIGFDTANFEILEDPNFDRDRYHEAIWQTAREAINDMSPAVPAADDPAIWAEVVAERDMPRTPGR